MIPSLRFALTFLVGFGLALALTLPACARPRGAATPTVAIDLNQASPELLATLPGIGPKRADEIARTRARRAFRSVGELARVPGIGPRTVARLRPYVRVGALPSGAASSGASAASASGAR
jgi:type II secretory pathway component PulK